VTSSLAMFEAAVWAKSTYMIKSILKIRKKEKVWQSNNFFYINFHLKDRLQLEFTAC